MHARYYGAALGQFTNPDPRNAGADLYNPQSWNGYAYGLNSPLSYTDPSGLGIGNWFSNFWNTVSGWFGGSQSCGAMFCATGYGLSDTNTASMGAGGGLVFDGGGAMFTATGWGHADVPTVSTSPQQPLQPAKTGACPAGATAAGLDYYSRNGRQHIEQLHMIFLPNGQGNNFTYYRRNGVYVPRSQYVFDGPGTADQYWNLVMQINAKTFALATPQSSRGNMVFTATLGPQNNPVPGARPFFGIEYGGSFNLFGFKVPVIKSHTSTNTLVTRSDCQTVVTSYPGNP